MNPTNSDAALRTIGSYKDFILTIINLYIVPLIFALAFAYFLWMSFRFFIVGKGSEEATSQGRQFLVSSIIGFVIMIGVWGIVNLAVHSLPIDTHAQPDVPTFNPSGSATSNTSNSGNNSNQSTSNPFVNQDNNTTVVDPFKDTKTQQI